MRHGFALRRSPGSPEFWGDVFDLDDQRVAVVIGRCADPTRRGVLRPLIADSVRATADPVSALKGVGGPAESALCAIINAAAAQFSCSHVGDAVAVLVTPDSTRQLSGGILLPDGATVLMAIPHFSEVPDGVERYPALNPDEAAQHFFDRLVRRHDTAVAALYRQPPGPLTVTFPARPASLATVRAELRRWLAIAGVGPETSADALLAVGEATSNAAEHSVVGSAHTVEMTVRASMVGRRLRLTVSDNGRWKPPAVSTGHRGHGIRLMTALVDDIELTAGDDGTTVDMHKELRP